MGRKPLRAESFQVGSVSLSLKYFGEGRFTEAAFRQAGVEPPSRLVESVSILTNAALLQQTDMLGVMPINVARHYAGAGALAVLDVVLPPPSGPVGTITRAGTGSNPVLEQLLQALRDAGAAIAGGGPSPRKDRR